MPVAFDDIESRVECSLIQGIRQLTQPSAHGWDDASFAQLTAFDIATAPPRLSDLRPEAKQVARSHLHAIDRAQRDTQILNFAQY